jgi:hypothetical protein
MAQVRERVPQLPELPAMPHLPGMPQLPSVEDLRGRVLEWYAHTPSVEEIAVRARAHLEQMVATPTRETA